MIISLIAAMAQNRVIGRDGRMPWYISEELEYFHNTTRGHTVIAGRKNFESIRDVAADPNNPLPGREIIVMTRDEDYSSPGIHVVHDKQTAMEKAAELAGDEEVFVIGGAKIYELFLHEASKLYLTEIHQDIEGDTYFPEFNEQRWQRTWSKKRTVRFGEIDFSYTYQLFELKSQ